MRRHFMHRHLNDKIIIEEEGELPRCPSCGIFGRVNQAHQRNKMCKEGTIRKDHRDMIREQYQARRVKFKIGAETQSQDSCICREKSDLSKMSAFHTYSEQCQPAYLVANRKLSLTHYSKYPKVASAAGSQNGSTRVFTPQQ
jgi:hypothetical protein